MNNKFTRNLIVIFVFAAIFIIAGLKIFFKIPEDLNSIFIFLLGTLVKEVKNLIDYFFK